MKKTFALFVLFAVTVAFSSATDADAVVGTWITDGGKSKVEISKCDKGYCGKIVYLKEAVYPEGDPMAGKKKVDRNNPDKAEHDQPIEGLQILYGFKFKKDAWEGGRIYDPENGKTYKCTMKLTNDGNSLEVRGFIGFSLLGRTTIWTRES